MIKDQIINKIDWLFNQLEERLESHLHWAFSPVDDHLMKIDHYWHATLVDKESGWIGELVFWRNLSPINTINVHSGAGKRNQSAVTLISNNDSPVTSIHFILDTLCRLYR